MGIRIPGRAPAAHENPIHDNHKRHHSSRGEEDAATAQFVQIHLLAGMRGIFQMTRICMGPLVVCMSSEYSYHPEDKGQILGAFAAGYMLTQVVGGMLADRLGSSGIMLLGLVSSGVSLLLLPLAAAAGAGVSCLWWLLFLMGVLQGPTYPAQLVTTAKCARGGLRSYASALAGASSTAGSLGALGLTPVVAARLGWRAAAWLFGTLTLLFGLVFCMLDASASLNVAAANEQQSAEQQQQEQPEQQQQLLLSPPCGGQKPPLTPVVPSTAAAVSIEPWHAKLRIWRKVLFSAPALAVFAAHTVHNFVRYFLMSWMPTYYAEVLRVPPDAAGMQQMLPELCGLGASLLAANVGKSLLERGILAPLSSRRLFASVAFLAPFVGLLGLSTVDPSSPRAALTVTAWLCFVQGCATLQGLGFGASYMDISLHHGGLVTGVGNTAATCGSCVSPVVAAWVLASASATVTTGSSGDMGGVALPSVAGWQWLFLVFACSNLAGLALYVPFVSTVPVDATEEELVGIEYEQQKKKVE